MTTIDAGGAAAGALLIVGKLLDSLVAKGLLTASDREQIVKDALAATGGEMHGTVSEALKMVFPGL